MAEKSTWIATAAEHRTRLRFVIFVKAPISMGLPSNYAPHRAIKLSPPTLGGGLGGDGFGAGGSEMEADEPLAGDAVSGDIR